MKSAAFPEPAKTSTGMSASIASQAADNVSYPPFSTTTNAGALRSPEHNPFAESRAGCLHDSLHGVSQHQLLEMSTDWILTWSEYRITIIITLYFGKSIQKHKKHE